MRTTIIAWFTVSAMLAAAATGADETSIVKDLLGPEGPLSWTATFTTLVGSPTRSQVGRQDSEVLNKTEDCGHNGLALTSDKTFLLACTNNPGAILELDMSGKQLRRWDKDSNGKKFEGGINDIVVTANGGAYATVFGPYADPPVRPLS